MPCRTSYMHCEYWLVVLLRSGTIVLLINSVDSRCWPLTLLSFHNEAPIHLSCDLVIMPIRISKMTYISEKVSCNVFRQNFRRCKTPKGRVRINWKSDMSANFMCKGALSTLCTYCDGDPTLQGGMNSTVTRVTSLR